MCKVLQCPSAVFIPTFHRPLTCHNQQHADAAFAMSSRTYSRGCSWPRGTVFEIDVWGTSNPAFRRSLACDSSWDKWRIPRDTSCRVLRPTWTSLSRRCGRASEISSLRVFPATVASHGGSRSGRNRLLQGHRVGSVRYHYEHYARVSKINKHVKLLHSHEKRN